MQPFVSWSLSVYTLNQVACFMQFVYKLFPPKWRFLTMKTLSYKLRRLSIYSFDQITSLHFSPFQSCFIYHMLTLCFYLLMMLKPPDLKPRSLIGQRLNVSWSLLYRIEHGLSQSVYHATSKSCMIQSNNTIYTVFFGLWYKYHDTCFTV